MAVLACTTWIVLLLVWMSAMSTISGNDDVQPQTGAAVNSDIERGRTCGDRPYDNKNVFGQPPDSNIRDVLPENYVDYLDVLRQRAGPSMNKIVGGRLAMRGEFPWQGRIKLLYPDGTVFKPHHCGAVIVNEHWLLSAAHCFKLFKEYVVRVLVGDYSLKLTDDGEQEFDVERIINHQQYEFWTGDNDIALLKIRPTSHGRGIQFNKFVQPACLPEPTTPYTEGTNCLISGWGSLQSGTELSPVILQEAEVPLIHQTVCKNMYINFTITDAMFCAGYVSGGIDTCQGDSGGPLVCKTEGAYTLYGLTSWGEGCAVPGYPGVYARVSAFLPWIQSNINLYSETIEEGTIPSKP